MAPPIGAPHARSDRDPAGAQDGSGDPVAHPERAPSPATGADAAGTRLGEAVPHESARLHVTGRAAYTDDLPEPAGTLHMALGLSPKAAGRIADIDVERLRAMPGVVDVLVAADIPGTNDWGSIVHDDPILAQGSVRYVGQPVFAVVAHTRLQARVAAARAKDVLHIDAPAHPPRLDAWSAHEAGDHVLPPMRLERATHGGVDAALARAPHRLEGRWAVGGQEQFYLEGQISLAVPQDDDGMLVHCSTQHPTEMQHLVAHALGLAAHHVQVVCRRMGGGFGGKESQSAPFACIAAVAARRLGCAVKLRLDRDDDFLATGRRHGFDYAWQAGHDGDGRILALDLTMVSNAGHSADLSGPVMTRAVCHVDNAYWLPDVRIHGCAARTATQSNTAFRGFGGPQGSLVTEWLLDTIARRLGRDPLDVRRANVYGVDERNVTPYGQRVEGNIALPLIDALAQSSDYRARRAALHAANAREPVLQRGIALTPVKFGISFNVPHFNQAGALVHVYTDGSVLVNHGGTEMGQGLHTKVAQVVADTFGLPLHRVRATATDTQKVANTSATAASTGSDLNGMAALDAAQRIRHRLEAFVRRTHPDVRSVRFADQRVWIDGRPERWADVVAAAYRAAVPLAADGFYATPGITWDRETMQGHPFFYFAWGAACSEVVVDTLTGEWRLVRADLLHDVGRSMNPAIDVGQIEGAFVQGTGWLTCEELVWNARTGALATHAPSTYKIPTANDAAPDLRTALWNGDNPSPTIHRSKAVGEPPLLLAFSVLLAIRDAVAAVAGGRVADVPLRAPATPEAILDAVEATRRLDPAGAAHR